ncbi:anti-phage protein KwaA [Natranaerovirga hydrolytica]|uniref:anti-phage protein KwaA n=1 Tax=Natranaerovirga hydrolytica TaxID=680378 RepID=UPI001046020B|nr:anti-phage protein KwaA [Natranaerovirga hydrolytica]
MNRKKKQEEDDNISLKIQLYIMSLWLLFLLIFMLTVDIPISFASDAKFIGIKALLQRNILAIISMVMVVLGIILTHHMQYRWKGVTNPPYRVKSIKNENYEYLTFLTTYIIPLICIDLNNIRYVIVLGILLFLIGFIFIKMDLYYGNPTLALLGYRLYKIEIENINNTDGIVVISKERLATGSSIDWMEIDKNIWFVKENKQ